ncbi:hypothetical protein N0Y54_12075 [Nostoc punctiforme UO1]|uniref:hypothetical protein n=1 Tax=Nostoc punctiforme TaxID=272131 RepID=UPI0030B39121
MIAHGDYKLHSIFLSLEQLYIVLQRGDVYDGLRLRNNSLLLLLRCLRQAIRRSHCPVN